MKGDCKIWTGIWWLYNERRSRTNMWTEDIILEIKAAAICGADMKHWRVDNGSDEFNSIRGHEFAGEIVQVGEKVTDWKVGQESCF